MKNLFYAFLNKFIFKLGFVVRGNKKVNSNMYSNLEDLLTSHFNYINEPNHLCRESLSLALKQANNYEKLIILETGSSAWGTNSTELFDKFISFKNENNTKNAFLYSCDIRINPLLNLLSKVSNNTYLICNDSVKCLEGLCKTLPIHEFNFLIYLDSFDLDYSNPLPFGLHGFKEFIAILPFLKSGTVLVIDDSPVNIDLCPESAKKDTKIFHDKYGVYPGKGMFIEPVISKIKNIKKVFHKYQIVYIVE